MSGPTTYALILAAGRGARFGSDKRLAILQAEAEPHSYQHKTGSPESLKLKRHKTSESFDRQGATVLETTLNKYTHVFDRVFVVLRPEDEEIAAMTHELGVTVIYAAEAHLGMGHSLAAGVSTIQKTHEACEWLFVGLLDMPFVTLKSLQILKDACTHAEPRSILRPRHIPTGRTDQNNDKDEKAWGHPIGWHAAYLPELVKLTGDEGARNLLRKHNAQVVQVALDDSGVNRDIDHPQDLTQGGQAYLEE